MNYELLADKTRYFKENPEGVSEMCKVMEDMRNEAAKRAEEQTTIDHIKDIMTKLKYTVEQAMDLLSIPPADRATYSELVGKKTV
ncbi:MAG: hypothetical protein IJT16_11730 [Lachnospiraceae bacterium]|nr:hypothetical protein [Lachnospiraceae bacterium]